jgi:asparagine synthase (glutamine-hydrolysing)
MCGIVGYWVQRGDSGALRRSLSSAVETLRHRGPDAGGVWQASEGVEVGLGHRRLSILDLSRAGAQPMVAPDAEIAVVFNGEIYNFADIATELKSRGHRLFGHGDTEVILAAWREWGEACVDRFIGMFAFAIWDGPNRTLSLCRDRVGVKPLYYSWDGGVFAFASELKALRALPHWSVEVDRAALGEFLQYGYIGTPRSIYRGVKKLPPGCWLHLEDGGEPRLQQYWSLRRIVEKGPLTANEAQLEEELEALLVSAFRYRLVSDVPVGLFLSGGVDSSLVAGILKSAGVALDTFTIGFASAKHDESEAAAKVAANLGLANHAEMIDMAEAERILDLWSDIYDEPYGDHSGIPTYLVSRVARERVTVALSADGGDELFCGYSGYVDAAERMTAHVRVPASLRRLGSQGLALAASGPLGGTGGAGSRLNRALGHGFALDRTHKLQSYLAASPGLDSLRPFRTFWQTGEVKRLLGDAYYDPRAGTLAWPGEPLEQIAALDFHEYLPDDVLTKTDRATMAAGLEGREPLLDHRIVELAFRLPLAMRLGPLGNKHVLRSILYRHVPRALVDRPKQGFAVPLGDWMGRLLSSGAVAGSIETLKARLDLDGRALDGVLAAFSGSDQGRNRLWLLHVLGLWAQRWL